MEKPSKPWKKLHGMIFKPQNNDVGVANYIAANPEIDINYIPPSPSKQGYLPLLHRALRRATVPDLKSTLSVPGIDVNLNCPGFGTPLIFIIHYDDDIKLEANMERINLLLNHEDININGPECPLLEAVTCRRPEIVNALLKHHTIDIDLSVVGIPMIENRMVTILEELIKGEQIDINSEHDGTTLLVQLISNRNINFGNTFQMKERERIIGLVLQSKNTDVNNTKSSTIARHGHFDPLSPSFKENTKNKTTALQAAINLLSHASNFAYNVINMLLSHDQIDLKQDLPLFQLHDVNKNAHNKKLFLDLWKTFLSHPGVDINAIHEGNMILYVVLHHYIYREQDMWDSLQYEYTIEECWETAQSAVVQIMKHPKFNVNAVINDKHQTLLLYTAEYMSTLPSLWDIFKDTLRHQNVNLNTMDANNMTVIRHTFIYLIAENTSPRKNKESVADIIIKQHIEDERYLADSIHTDGSTDLHWLVSSDLKYKTAVTSYLLCAKPQMDVNVQNRMGETVLDIIMNQKGVQYQKDDIKLLDIVSDLLLHDKFDRQFLNKTYEDGLTVIHVLFANAELINDSRMQTKWLDVFKMEEIDYNIQDKNGNTPIMYAVKIKNDFSLEAVKIAFNMLKGAQNSKEKSASESDYISEISLEDHIKCMHKSVQRNIQFNRLQKEDLHLQLQRLASDIHQYMSDERGIELEMSKEHRGKIRGCRVYLVENLDTTDILDHLIQDGIITEHQEEEIKLPGIKKDRVLKLLSILPTRGPEAYYKFIEGLRETKQEHIAETLENFNPQQKDAVVTSGGVAVGPADNAT